MSNPTVLLIDYEPASIEQMKGPLLAAGYNVEVVFDGLAGLKAFKDMKPDLVLIEAMIPKKHGFEVCQEIKKTPEGKNTPVVIATSIYKGRKYRNQALKNYGCDEYLEKPVACEDLMEVCRRYLKEVKQQAVEVAEQHETASDEGAAAPMSQSEPSRRADQGLNNLDAMNEKEIADKLDEILGAFGEAVDDAKDSGIGEAQQPTPAPEQISDQDMVMELLDEVGNAEPGQLTELAELTESTELTEPTELNEEPQEEAFEEEAMPEPEPVMDPVTETEPEPVLVGEQQMEVEETIEPEPVVDAQAEVAAQLDEVLPDGAYEGRTAEEYLSGVPAPEPSAAKSRSGARFLGLGVPAWVGIAVAVIAAVVAGVMFLGGSDDAVTAPPEKSGVAMSQTFQKPVPFSTLEQAGPGDAVSLEGGTTGSSGGMEVIPERIDPTPADTRQLPDPEKPAPNAAATTAKVKLPVKKETSPPVKRTTAKVTPPVKKKASPPAERTTAKVTPPVEKKTSPPVNSGPAPDKPEPSVADPSPTEVQPQIKPDPGPQPAPAGSREVVAPQEQVIHTAAPVSKPVVQERAQRVLAKPGDLVPLNSVDSPPVQQVNVAAKYHPMARKLGQQGTVQLNLLIDETGSVTDVKVVKEIPNSTLNHMAVKAARRWVYDPALKDSVPVKVWKQVSVQFRL